MPLRSESLRQVRIQVTTLGDLLLTAADRYPHSPALIFPDRRVTYAELAERIGRPTAVRAVGLANGSNPVGIVVPCHRVIGANGSLTGYGGGIERKRWLLEHEGGVGSERLGMSD